MADTLLPTLAKILLPAAAIGVMLFVAKKKRLAYPEDVGFRAPKIVPAAVFLLLWIGLVTLEEVLTASVPGAQAKAWPDYPAYIVAMRVLAIGILGPIAEELAFRGVLFAVLRRTPLKVAGTIVVTAALWSLSHLQYEPIMLALIFVDGVVLGTARQVSGSLYLPMAMHILGNLFSISQSLGH